jgi:hypothetical protein
VTPERGDDYEYQRNRIELREREGGPQLLIDNMPVRYGQLANGQYFLHDYAFDWTDDLIELARRYIDYRRKAEEIRRERRAGKGDE